MLWQYIFYLPPSNDVIPDAGAAKVDVKVGVTASDRHETVLLDLENKIDRFISLHYTHGHTNAI